MTEPPSLKRMLLQHRDLVPFVRFAKECPLRRMLEADEEDEDCVPPYARMRARRSFPPSRL
jgi:hypothetical protein